MNYERMNWRDMNCTDPNGRRLYFDLEGRHLRTSVEDKSPTDSRSDHKVPTDFGLRDAGIDVEGSARGGHMKKEIEDSIKRLVWYLSRAGVPGAIQEGHLDVMSHPTALMTMVLVVKNLVDNHLEFQKAWDSAPSLLPRLKADEYVTKDIAERDARVDAEIAAAQAKLAESRSQVQES